MRGWRRLGLALGLMAVSACAGLATSRPEAMSVVETGTRIEALRTPLGPIGATLAPGVAHAGGLVLRGPAMHGLSDLKVAGDRAWAVSDLGALVRFRLRLDDEGRLVSIDQGGVRALAGLDGAVLSPKERADAEGLVLRPDGSILVSFERDHRIWAYGRDGRPAPVPHPDADFPDNAGMEGLAPAGDDAWLVLGEAGGGWICRRTGCTALALDPAIGSDGFRVTGADRDPAGDSWFIVERYFSPPVDMRARVRRLARDGRAGPILIELRPPASVDNMEGIAAVATSAGTRLYLLSDDNANPLQRTLLLAFDVIPVPRP
jgi:hypothetical protein